MNTHDDKRDRDPKENPSDRAGKRRKDVRKYSQYYGMAFQIFGLLVVTVLIGMQVDKYLGNESNYVAVLLSFIVLVAYFYKLVIMLGNDK